MLAVGAVAVGNALRDAPIAVPVVLVVAIGVAAAIALPRVPAASWALGCVPACALIGSRLLPNQLYLAPMVATATAAAVAALRARSLPLRGAVRLRSPLLLGVAVYLGLLLVSAAVSDEPLGAFGTAGTAVAVVVAAFVLLPALDVASVRRDLVVVIAATTAALAAASLVLWATGPFGVGERVVGEFVPNEVVYRGDLTGLVLPRVSGIYATPGYQSLATMTGLVVLVAMRRLLDGRARALAGAAVATTFVALVLTMSRGGWIGAVVGLAVIARTGARPALDLLAAGCAVVLLALVLALGAGWVGTVQRLEGVDVSADRLSRGGTSLEGRDELWQASLEAIEDRPLLGYGPGRNAVAIAPHLEERYRSLGSHNALLRTAVESGIGAALALAAVVVAVAVRSARSWRTADASTLALMGAAAALTLSSITETMLLGGLALPNLLWTASLGLLGSSRAEP